MTLHVAAQNWHSTEVTSYEWQIFNFYDAVVRFGVPVFVMISGALFLNPNKIIPIKKIYSKYIFRIFTAFVFWSFTYAFISYIMKGGILRFAASFIRGHYHLWFLFMIAGLYAIVPFVKRIAESESLTKYFLVLALVSAFCVPESIKIISGFSKRYAEFAQKFINGFNVKFTLGFTGYFLLGYFLDKTNITPKLERIIYFLGMIGFAFTILASSAVSVYRNRAIGYFYGNLTVNVLCESIAVFVFFKQHFNQENKLIRKLSQYSFGAYLVHAGIITVLNKLGLNSLTFNPLFSVPVIAVLTFIISFTISAILNHIPKLNKYIV